MLEKCKYLLLIMPMLTKKKLPMFLVSFVVFALLAVMDKTLIGEDSSILVLNRKIGDNSTIVGYAFDLI